MVPCVQFGDQGTIGLWITEHFARGRVQSCHNLLRAVSLQRFRLDGSVDSSDEEDSNLSVVLHRCSTETDGLFARPGKWINMTPYPGVCT